MWSMLDVAKGAYARYHRILKFAVSGCIVALVSVLVLSFLTEVCKLWYLFSSTVAFLVGVMVNFFLQKTWTFRENVGEVGMQMGLFFANSLLNLVLNTVFMYGMVDLIGIQYVVSQMLIMVALAVMNYTMYRLFIFRTPISNVIDTTR
jgi:putative flippase GtrA